METFIYLFLACMISSRFRGVEIPQPSFGTISSKHVGEIPSQKWLNLPSQVPAVTDKNVLCIKHGNLIVK